MKYLIYNVVILFFFNALVCNDITSAQSFDSLYRMTPATYITHHLMHIWQDIQQLAYDPASDDYVYYEIIGHIMHIHDVVKELIITQEWFIISEDIVDYWLYTVNCIVEDATILQEQGRFLLYKRLIQALNKLWQIISS